MSFKDEVKDLFTTLIGATLIALTIIIGINVYSFIQSKFSHHINPEAIVVIGDVQKEALKYDLNNTNDKTLQNIVKSVLVISKQAEQLTFKDIYKKIKKLNYYDLPPLYWDQLNKSQKIKAFNVWENYMKSLISQCGGNEFIKFSSDEIERCVELKKRQIEKRKRVLFN